MSAQPSLKKPKKHPDFSGGFEKTHSDLDLPVPKTKFHDLSYEKFNVDVLIVVASAGLKAVKRKLKPPVGFGQIVMGVVDSPTYLIGIFGGHPTAVVQCDPESGGPIGSSLTVLLALKSWKPKKTIMIGVTFGLRPETQSLGDILVSSSIVDSVAPYSPQIQLSNSSLYQQFSKTDNWEFSSSKVFRGQLFSGDTFVDSDPFAKEILQRHSDAIGGDMESAGFAKAAIRESTECIIVKAIVNFGGLGEFQEPKEVRPFAAAAATSLVEWVLFQSKSL